MVMSPRLIIESLLANETPLHDVGELATHIIDALHASGYAFTYNGTQVTEIHTLDRPRDEFEQVLSEMLELHRKKSEDYGSDEDPYTNIRSSENFGVLDWVGALIRENDKTTRIQSFLKKGKLANESVEDSLWDKAVYSVIAIVLYRRKKDGTG